NKLNIENSANLYFINCTLTGTQIISTGQISLINSTSTTDIQINDGVVSVVNSTLGGKISVKKNKGTLVIGDNVDFDSNLEIINDGTVTTNNPEKILLYLKNIKGSYVINDAVITKTHNFDGSITLNNCTITSTDNRNYGILNLNNCTVNVGPNNTFLTNANKVYISKDTKITGKINDPNNGVTYEGAGKTYVVKQDTINLFFDTSNEGRLSSIVKPGDTLDFQGKIELTHSLIIDKPVNIISSTKDSYIDLHTIGGSYFGENPGNAFVINKDGAYTNVTGVYFHNTQLWIYNTNHVTLDRISAVVEDQRVGSGVGQTSIRQNSSYITVKNSYFRTKDNEGSSTLVLAWADYCTIENNTIEGEGTVGNLLYLTTYNINIPTDIVYNSHNKIINNTIRGPQEPSGICYGICISGYDNIIDSNTLTYSGQGIMFQWGSGVTNVEQDECLFGSGENVVSNNKLYGGCGIETGDIVYNNYMEGLLRVYGKAYNNTANELYLFSSNANVTNNTILGEVTLIGNYEAITNCIMENNTIVGTITITNRVTNTTIKGNDIQGNIIIEGSNNTITDNKIISDSKYSITIIKLAQNNKICDNYLLTKTNGGDLTVNFRDESNIVANNIPVNTKVELVSPSEAIINKAIVIVIKLVDTDGNLIKDAQVLISSSNGNETVTLTDGTYNYQYTPRKIGEDTITVKYTGNHELFRSTNSTKINVIAESENPKEEGKTTPEQGKQPATEQQTTPAKSTNKVTLTLTKAIPKTISKKAKKLVISAKLKVGTQLAKKEKVTFTVKDKKYTRKTNNKGIAKLTLNKKQLSKILKKVKTGKKIKIQIKYNKQIITKYIKVKK
ncbi:MAG: hypothetical protein BZ138_08520, partial [Methanosphaera sp. rholeuAM270]